MHLCFIFSSAPKKQGQKGNKSSIDEEPAKFLVYFSA